MIFSLGAGTGSIVDYWPVLVILVALVVLYVISMVRRKKDMNQAQQMLNELKPGMKVKTYTGFYGTIDSIRETTDGKVVMLKIGEEGGKVGYIEIDANAIYGVDSKTDVVYDKDGNIIVKEDKKAQKEEKTVLEDSQKPVKKSKKDKKQEEFEGWSASDIKTVKDEPKKSKENKKEEK